MAKTRNHGKLKVIEVLPSDEKIVHIDEIRIVCLVQNELTGKLTSREISMGSDEPKSGGRDGNPKR